MRSQSHSHLRFVHQGMAVILSIALHIGVVRLRLPTPLPPVTPQVKIPPLAIPQQAVQVRPRPPEQNLDVSPPPPIQRQPPPLTQTPSAAQASTPPPAPMTSAPPIDNSIAVEPGGRSQEQEPPPSPPTKQSKHLEESPPKDDLPDVESDSSSDSDPDPSPDQGLALQWDGLISNIQAGESEFGQAQFLQDIFVLYGQEEQFDLFFDQAEKPKVQVLSYQLFTGLTPQQVWEEKILPTLEKQDSIEITEDQMFAEGKVYRISQGEFVRYLNVVPLHRPKEVVLLEMAKPPAKEN